MRRYLHPVAFFAVVLLLAGLLVTLLINGIANAELCRGGCSPAIAELRLRLALVCLAPGIVLGVITWDSSMTLLILRRDWRAAAALLGIPVAVWVVLLRVAPAIPTVGVRGLGDAHANGLLAALAAGAVMLLPLACVLFVLPVPSDRAARAKVV